MLKEQVGDEKAKDRTDISTSKRHSFLHLKIIFDGWTKTTSWHECNCEWLEQTWKSAKTQQSHAPGIQSKERRAHAHTKLAHSCLHRCLIAGKAWNSPLLWQVHGCIMLTSRITWQQMGNYCYKFQLNPTTHWKAITWRHIHPRDANMAQHMNIEDKCNTALKQNQMESYNYPIYTEKAHLFKG